ncbi:MAG TPA: hypothetical protein VH109_13050 [Steroidobacteraceae bacterium]|jgi:hypothetical protein|nr:hypothetical protein [Steroidobacteraceae bacterium]
MHTARTVTLESHATATLQYIRTSMEAAVSIAVPGTAGLVMGSVGVLAAVLSELPALRAYWLMIWLIAAVMAIAAGAVLMARPAVPGGLTLRGTRAWKFALSLAPSLLAGAVLTLVHWQSGNLRAIPGTWLLLYGCALVAASVTTTAAVAAMGACFVGLGVLALFVLPPGLQLPALGVGFGGLHLLFALLIGRIHHDIQG